ncbi:prephenate dehydrogenase [Albibacterium indicum]|uniref:prephenate dehydrogenase n=1 Tax=Albibacterium indicum TaxID=2292082 RepID=UPI000E4C1CF5|nr:prephenate dehydrogenase [Pedobacter indicus]
MKVTIIGLGLIGGSIAIKLKEANFATTITGVDKSKANQEKALKLNIVDTIAELEKGIKDANLIVLAIPVDAIKLLLPGVLDLVTDKQVVMEMGSTKQEILASVDQHPKRGRLVACHPMAGTEYSGPEAAIPNLYDGKNMVFCDVTKTDEDAFELAENVCEALEMKPIFMHAKEHDLHAAYVSHISHITSFGLALTVLEKEKSQGRIFELASGGFASTVRLAKSSPEMWVPIFEQNREHVLEVLREQLKQLQHFHDLLEKEDYPAVHKLIKQANKIKRIIK